MTLHVHRLAGCTPRPLANYLKALAVLRLVAEQKDSGARGFWRADVFHLVTSLDAEGLSGFFLREWEPTALVSPWNKGSGFFDLEHDKGLAPLRRSKAPRFGPMRAGIAAAEVLLADMDAAVASLKAIKAESNAIKDAGAKERFRSDPVYKQRLARAEKECKRLKDELQPECQRRWRGGELRWLRAAVVLHGDDRAEFPALLGTGGNDGKLDFTNNAYQRLGDLFDFDSGEPRPGAADLLRSALWGDPVTGRRKGGIGQFSPAASGGANATSGALAESLLNPWDLPLLLEGSVLFGASSTRRLASRGPAQAAAPFAVRGQSSGYGSASASDDAQGTRGEQWMPLWERPWNLDELASVLAEGRCQVGSKSGESALDVARAVARLGVARGISSFERFGYLTRNGKSNYAVPLGQWEVRAQASGRLLDDLDRSDWWSRVRRAAREEHAPASFVRCERVLSDAVMAVLSKGNEPARWTRVLVALAELEAQMVSSGAFTVKTRLNPIPALSPGWLGAVENSPELRLAMSLAAASHPDGRSLPVRGHWLPLDRRGRFHTRDKGLARDERVVCTGRNAEEDLVALVARRLTEAEAPRTFPLRVAAAFAASPSDLGALLDGDVDLEQTMWLVRALSAVDWTRVTEDELPPRRQDRTALDPAWLALRLTHLGFPLPRGEGSVRIPVDPSPVRLLATGNAARAFEVVQRRLRAASIEVPFRVATVDPLQARRYAASLAFPISPRTAVRFARLLDPASHDEELSHVR